MDTPLEQLVNDMNAHLNNGEFNLHPSTEQFIDDWMGRIEAIQMKTEVEPLNPLNPLNPLDTIRDVLEEFLAYNPGPGIRAALKALDEVEARPQGLSEEEVDDIEYCERMLDSISQYSAASALRNIAKRHSK